MMDSDGIEEGNGTLSRMSSESSSSYDLIPPENEKKHEQGNDTCETMSPVLEYFVAEKDLQDAISNTNNVTNSPSTANIVGKSIFYDCLDPSSINTGADLGECLESSSITHFESNTSSGGLTEF